MNLYDLTVNDRTKIALNDVFFSDENKAKITQIVKEHQHLETLKKFKLQVDNKILLYGHSGCGKTTTAKAIATALNKPIIILNLSTFVSSKIGETSLNIKAVFDKAARDRTVLFLDEFDQIGKIRGNDEKDVGEMRRLVNTIIQLIDYLSPDTILICATNHYSILDSALLRRFQLKLEYVLPNQEELDSYYERILGEFPESMRGLERIYDISYAEAKDYMHTTVKRMIIEKLESGEEI